MITFNGYSLQTSNIIISDISHEDVSRGLVANSFSTRNGSNLVRDYYGDKQIKMSGSIIGTDKNDLESRIEELKKETQNVINKTLALDYNSTTREYKATCNALSFGRQNYTVNFIEFTLSFVVVESMAVSTTETETALNSIALYSGVETEKTSTNTVNFNGTREPQPVIELIFGAGANVVNIIKVENIDANGFFSRTRITLDEDYNQAGNTIIIDTKQCLVYDEATGDNLVFKDGFPKFTLESNALNIKLTGTALEMTANIKYYEHNI